MSESLQKSIQDARVSTFRLSEAAYPQSDRGNEIAHAISKNCENLGWAENNRGAFGKLINEGARVVIKPNFVLHANEGSGGLLPLITHPSLIKAVVEEVLKANPGQVMVGDAPIQSCDLDKLLYETGLDEWTVNLQNLDARFKGIHDFRRTVCLVKNGVRTAREEIRPAENYILYNLGSESLLEPISDDKRSFRVTCYDPRLMEKTHSPGNHQYLLTKEVIEADVVINLPKLKTHKKAGITNALKNLVGINGNKEFLPHHRIGGSEEGGDCYPGSNRVKRTLESVLDYQNKTSSLTKARLLAITATQLQRIMRLQGDETGVEGSWSGNETVARMTLDLNRILLYGKIDATLAERVQRRVVHIVDAVIAGQGEGPLASDELSLGMIFAGENACAVDWVGAHLLGYDVKKIPLLQHALEDFRWPIADFEVDEIKFVGDWGEVFNGESMSDFAKTQVVKHPVGWRSAAA